MNIGQAIDISTALSGTLASLFFALSTLSQTPEIMLSLTPSHSNACFSADHIKSMAEQKANSLVGSGLLAITFLLQIIKAFVNTDHAFQFCWLFAIGLIAVLLIFGSFRLCKWYTNRIIGQVYIIVGKEYCSRNLSGKITITALSGHIHECEFYMRDKRRSDESIEAFFTRFAVSMQCSLPTDIDLSEVKDS